MKDFLYYFFNFTTIIATNHINNTGNIIFYFYILGSFLVGFTLFKAHYTLIYIIEIVPFFIFATIIVEIIISLIFAFLSLSFDILRIKFSARKNAQKILEESEFFLKRIEEDKKTIEEIEINILKAKERIEYLENFFKKDIEFLNKQDENFDKFLVRVDPATKNKMALNVCNSCFIISVFEGKVSPFERFEFFVGCDGCKIYEKNTKKSFLGSDETEYKIEFCDECVKYYKNLTKAPNNTEFTQKFYKRDYSSDPANELITFKGNRIQRVNNYFQKNEEKSDYVIQYCANNSNQIRYEKNADEVYFFDDNCFQACEKNNQGPTIYNREKFKDIYYFYGPKGSFSQFERRIPVEQEGIKGTYIIIYENLGNMLRFSYEPEIKED